MPRQAVNGYVPPVAARCNSLTPYVLWLRASRACGSQEKLQRLLFGAGDNRKRQPRFKRTGTRTRASGPCEWE